MSADRQSATVGTREAVAGFKDAPADSGEPAADSQEKAGRRSALAIMMRLIVLIKPLVPVMLLAICLGIIGYLFAIFLTILASNGIVSGLNLSLETDAGSANAGNAGIMQPGILFAVLVIFAVLRGIFHYGEQYCNHFIAFKLLAIIRHKVFSALRRLCPAKLEGRDRGNLISVITSDIELLEVFYAHTISPIAIAAVVSLLMTAFIGIQYIPAALVAAAGYIVVGAVIPMIVGKKSARAGMELRNEFGEMSSYVLESLRGIEETIQFSEGSKRLAALNKQSGELSHLREKLNRYEMGQRAVTNLMIGVFSYGMLFMMLLAFKNGAVDFKALVLASLAMMGSFGPAAALSNLSNNLNQTLAGGERVLRLLEEKPEVEEVSGREETGFEGVSMENVYFSYDSGENKQILKDCSGEIPTGKIIGIHGPSGCGKSTLLKLLMRFWDVRKGKICISGRNIKDINTDNLRCLEAYVTQETYLYHDTIARNIALGKADASQEEIELAAKKAGIHDFITFLPEGYDTMVGELGENLSGGERQRIGLARAFLHDAPFMLLDEPTSNLDPLGEGIILKSILEAAGEKTVVLVSHRDSTMNIADEVYEMENGRLV